MPRWYLRPICWIKGHDYPGVMFTFYSLHFCRRCGKEEWDRSLAHLDPLPDDIDPVDFDMLHGHAAEPTDDSTHS